ncbi:unnamed protein product [Musa banksii]
MAVENCWVTIWDLSFRRYIQTGREKEMKRVLIAEEVNKEKRREQVIRSQQVKINLELTLGIVAVDLQIRTCSLLKNRATHKDKKERDRVIAQGVLGSTVVGACEMRPTDEAASPAARRPTALRHKATYETVAEISLKTIFMIPEDILHLEILPWLPNKTLSRFKSVCKRWFHLITYDTAFAWRHLSYHGSVGFIYIHDRKIEFRPINFLGKLDICKPISSFLPDDMQSASIVTSTNGLLLLKVKACGVFEKDTFYIWNLLTNEHNVIPQFCLNDYDMNVGLAYEPWATPTSYKLQPQATNDAMLLLDLYKRRTR